MDCSGFNPFTASWPLKVTRRSLPGCQLSCTPPPCQALFASSSKNRKANFSWIFWYFLYGISLSKVYIVGRQLIKKAIAVEKNRKIRSTTVLGALAPAAVQKCMSCHAKVRRAPHALHTLCTRSARTLAK